MLAAGHFSPGTVPSLNCTRVQIVLMWACSRNSECGKVIWAAPMLASPLRALRTALKAGVAPLLVPPLSERVSFGAKPRLAQSAAWKGLVTVIGWSSASEAKSVPEPSTVEAVEVRSQLVGLRVNSGWLM